MLSKEQKAHPMIRSDVLYMIKRRAKGAALPLYLQRCDDFSKFGHGRPRLPEVFKTVSSDWVATLGQKRKGPHSRLGRRARIAQRWAATCMSAYRWSRWRGPQFWLADILAALG
jgi:hypothetical protein